MYNLVAIANAIMGVGLLGAPDLSGKLPAGFEWVQNIVNAIYTVLWPVLIVVGAAGTIYAIVLGVNMARADSTEKREEAKKRLINVIVGIVIIVALILFFQLLLTTILPALLPDVAGGQA